MITSSVRAEVSKLLSLALRRPVDESEKPARDLDPAWDSLKHVEIVFLLEDHFELRFTDTELDQLHDAAQIAQVLEARRAA